MHATARTTSMLASAALLSALAIAGLTMSIHFTPPQIPDPTGTITVTEEPPPAPPPPASHPRTPPPPTDQAPIETIAPVDPPAVIENVSNDVWSPPAVPTIVTPHWLRRPANLQAYYPRRALQRSVEGVVQLECRVLTT